MWWRRKVALLLLQSFVRQQGLLGWMPSDSLRSNGEHVLVIKKKKWEIVEA